MHSEKLKRYLAGESPQDEKEEIQLWLEADKNNRKEFMLHRRLYDVMLAHLSEIEKPAVVSAPKKSTHIRIEILKIAAAVLITFGISLYFLKSNYSQPFAKKEPGIQTLHIPEGQRGELTLADGTKIWLNAKTTLSYPEYFTGTVHEVYLDGEGYFDVSHNPDRTFTVRTSSHKVEALGTEFNVSAYSKSPLFETSLLQGSVRILTNETSHSVLLTPGTRAFLQNNILIKDSINHYEQFLWTEGIICFEHESLYDILKKLELYYDTEIINNNDIVNQLNYTGKFRTKEGIDHVLNVLHLTTGLKYKKDNERNSIIIY